MGGNKELTLKDAIDSNYGMTIDQYCEKLAGTQMIPTAYRNRPSDIFVALAKGHEVGLSPLSALSSICVINGTPSLYGDGAIALCLQSGKLESINMYYDEELAAGVCVVKRKGMDREHTEVFTYKDAERAGLIGRGVWKQYPKRMLQIRARAFALRNMFPDILMGLKIAEEVMDYETNIPQNAKSEYEKKIAEESKEAGDAGPIHDSESEIADGEFEPIEEETRIQDKLLQEIFVLEQDLDDDLCQKLDKVIERTVSKMEVSNVSQLGDEVAAKLYEKLKSDDVKKWLSEM